MNGKLEVCRDGPENAGRIKKQDVGADAVCAPLTMRRSASVSTAFFWMSGSLVERQRMSGATPPAAITAALPVNSCDADSSSSDANSCIAPSSTTRRNDTHSLVVSEQSSIIIQSIIDCALLTIDHWKNNFFFFFKCITGNLALRYAYKYDNNIVVSCCDQQHFYVLNFFSWGCISLPPAPKYTHGSTQCKSVQVSTSQYKSVQVDLRAR